MEGGKWSQIRIWKDKWLNRSIALESQHPREGQRDDACVALTRTLTGGNPIGYESFLM